jgi:hypothetical protein
MVGLLDLLMQARESGRGARADLENSINYYIPPELRGLLGFAAEANPVVSMERAGQDAQRLVQPGLSGWDRMAAAGDMASNMAGVLAPMAAGRAVGMPAVRALEEGLLGMSMTPEAAAVRQFAVRDDGGVKLYHGSPRTDLTELLPGQEGTGALGPGVYGSPFNQTAGLYARDGGRVYDFEAPDDLMYGAGARWDDIPSNVSPYQVWRDNVKRLVDAAPEGQKAMIAEAGDRMVGDGYPFFRALASNLGSKEAAQELYKRAGFKGLTAMVDGPEAVLFDPVSLVAPSPTSNAFGEGWQDVYHWSRAPENFSEFDPNKSTSAMSQLGPHVGTPQAAEARYMGWSGANNTLPAQGFTMPLRADLSKPFLNPSTNQPWSEMDLEMFISAVADENGVDRRLIAPIMRERLASEGYTSIPYLNDVEDAGSVSNIMLTDRGGQSDAVLRSRFAAFDPRRARSGDLSAAVAAGVPLGLLAMQPEQEQY